MHGLGTFGVEVENYFVIFEISTLEFALLQIFVQKIKIPRFGTKKANFGAGILKYFCHI